MEGSDNFHSEIRKNSEFSTRLAFYSTIKEPNSPTKFNFYQRSILTKSQKSVDPANPTWRGVTFTTKKLNCLVCLAQGMDFTKTAKTLGISPSTLQAHLVELRWRLRFPSKKEMLVALLASDFGKSLKSLRIR